MRKSKSLDATLCEEITLGDATFSTFLQCHRKLDRHLGRCLFCTADLRGHLIEHFSGTTCLTRPYEIDPGNYAGSARVGTVDSGAPPTGWTRCRRTEVLGGPPSARTARQRSSVARGRSRPGKNAYGQNHGRMHSNGISKIAVHARSFAGRFDRHTDLQSAHRRIYDETRPDLFQSDSSRRNQSRASKSSKRTAGGDAGTPSHNWRAKLPSIRSVPCPGDAKPQ